MDVMSLRRGLMMGMGNQMVGINQAVVVGDGTNTITFPVKGRPYGFLISCDNDTGVTGEVIKRVDGVWSQYGGGSYVGMRECITRNAGYDHYNMTNDMITYDANAGTFTVTPQRGEFESGVTYYMWYFTIPF